MSADITTIKKQLGELQQEVEHAKRAQTSLVTRKVALLAKELFPLLDNAEIVNLLSSEEKTQLSELAHKIYNQAFQDSRLSSLEQMFSVLYNYIESGFA